MKGYLAKTPRIVSTIFKDCTWRFSPTQQTIYLTFDDGPTPDITPFVLETLAAYDAEATFFCIGKNCDQHPDLYRQVIRAGHSIGNHTHNHLKGFKTNTKEYLENTARCEAAFQGHADTPIGTKLFRPPYGKFKRKQAQQLTALGYHIVMWSVLSGDFDEGISKEKCLENVLKNTENGSIVVFHDSVKAADKLRYVLPKVLQHYSERGFVFSKIASL